MTATPEPFTWQIVDTSTNEVRRFYADGAALVATGTRAPHAFWQRHPLIAQAIETAGPDGETATVRIWLAMLGAPEAPNTARPSRPADMTLTGEWKTDVDFWAAHPSVEHVELHQLVDDDPAGDCWTASLWLKA
ncbi:hypothetical protein [Caulobacter sp. RL271]|uniref:Uncharacterized protein n=1 Tax=Caulobacter segnis TaxID=88688 RepID=A0ABY4ZWL4_9CAUL|nr:hypothetical protein [Caulobacter segnis]USQ97222.1 hypothetical protein MZV50_06685 [Caulobacter segnis]